MPSNYSLDVEDAMDAGLAALNGADDGREDRQEEQVEAIGDEEVERAEEHEEVKEDILEEFHRIIQYLQTFERPQNLTRWNNLQFQRYTTKFLLRNNQLFRRTKPGLLLKRVVWNL